tara:strand:- start:320 stop:757 length:438 start_codon:yes stop_codon:yes gene_type:complete
MPDDKKKQAMSLLFGDAPAKPKPSRPKKATPSPEAAPVPDATEEAPEATARREKTPARKRGGERPTPAPARATPPEAEITPDPYYQGASRYRRASGEQVKHSIYLDPDVSQAIKVAAAMGDDSRGTNVSAIVNQTLRDAGYGSDA